ncbi:glycosyl hydrolase [candidate division KSB1 bacterium]|nr:glycosyl hydrolase [candidate division KSB1 bacterium]
MKTTPLTMFILIIFSFASLECSAQSFKKANLLSATWPGYAICYSGYRNGQDPREQTYPTQEQILEDLKILEKHWQIIRTYGSDQHSRDVLEVIRRENIHLSVMLGIWLNGDSSKVAENEAQINTGIELANQYSDIVCAVNVGNEIMIYWSDHRMSEEQAIQYVRRVKKAVTVPVTVADDFAFWREHGRTLANELDFVAMHTYPIWGGRDIDNAMAVTIEHYESVKNALPDKKIIISEAGWATYTVGKLHAPRAGDESKQKRYFNELMTWSKQNNVPVFFFEAFDEPWKGSGTEGHWGVFSVDRKAKPVMQGLYPALMPDGPTSPGYDE